MMSSSSFHASAGLIGSGKLSGKISPDGRISAVGRLLMGRNPFDCVLRATSEGEVLKGGAIFTHVGANASLTAPSFWPAAHKVSEANGISLRSKGIAAIQPGVAPIHASFAVAAWIVQQGAAG